MPTRFMVMVMCVNTLRCYKHLLCRCLSERKRQGHDYAADLTDISITRLSGQKDQKNHLYYTPTSYLPASSLLPLTSYLHVERSLNGIRHPTSRIPHPAS